MPTVAKKKIVFYAKPELVELLKAECARTGASVSEVCRRAAVASLKPEPIEHRSTSATPVLIAGQRD